MEKSLCFIEKSSIDHDFIQKSYSIKLKPRVNKNGFSLTNQSRQTSILRKRRFCKKVILEQKRLIFIQSNLDTQNIHWKTKLYGHVGFTLK